MPDRSHRDRFANLEIPDAVRTRDWSFLDHRPVLPAQPLASHDIVVLVNGHALVPDDEAEGDPRLELYEARVTPLGDDAYHVRLVVHNTGWLPTYVTKKAAEKKVVRGVVCEIELPEGATLETGKLREELGQLEGRAYKPASPRADDATEDRAKVEWVVRSPSGGTAKLTARHDRAGRVVTKVALS